MSDRYSFKDPTHASGRYILDENKTPIPCEDLWEWANWFENSENRRVAHDEETGVSTVFLAVNHGITQEGAPILFETMAFGGRFDGHQERCCTYQEALEMHAKIVEAVKRADLAVPGVLKKESDD